MVALGWFAILLFLFIAIAACGYALYNHRQLTALEHSLNRNIQSLRRELDVVNSAAVGVGARLINVEKRLNSAIEKQQQFDAHADQHFYNQAASLAEEGVDAAQIAEKCGLSEAEARLMTLINNKSAFNAANSPDNTLAGHQQSIN